MSFKQVYENCVYRNTLKMLVYRENDVDHLVGYRIYCYNPADGTESRYDFALNVDDLLKFPNGEVYHSFLKEISPRLMRVQLFPDGKGGLATKAELASKKRVGEISGKKLRLALETVVKSFTMLGMYDLRKAKGI